MMKLVFSILFFSPCKNLIYFFQILFILILLVFCVVGDGIYMTTVAFFFFGKFEKFEVLQNFVSHFFLRAFFSLTLLFCLLIDDRGVVVFFIFF